MRTKKGAFFLPFLAVYFVVIAAAIIIIMVTKNQQLPAETIGERQLALIDARMEAEKAASFASFSAEKALPQAIFDMALKGGMQEPECGETDGFYMWKSEDKECYPSAEEIKSAFSELMKSYHGSYLAMYEPVQFPQNTYAYAVDDKTLRAEPLIPITIDIMGGASGKASAGSPSGNAAAYPGRLEAFPVAGKASFGNDWGAPRPQGNHEGTDIFAPEGTPVVAAVGGTVTDYGCNSLGGNFIDLTDSDGVMHYYAHLGRFSDEAKSAFSGKKPIPAGTKLGEVGTTIGCRPKGTCDAKAGDCGVAGKTVPHLHFGIYTFRNPGANAAKNPYFALKEAEGRGIITIPLIGTGAAPKKADKISGKYSLGRDIEMQSDDLSTLSDYDRLVKNAREIESCGGKSDYYSCLNSFNGEREGLNWNIGCGQSIGLSGKVKICVEGKDIMAFDGTVTKPRKLTYKFGIFAKNSAVPAATKDVMQKIVSAAKAGGVPADVALAIAKEENQFYHLDSKGNVVVNIACATGLMQIVPYNTLKKEYCSINCKDCKDNPKNTEIPYCPGKTMEDIYNPDTNIECGIKHIKGKYESTKNAAPDYDPFGCGYRYADPWDRAIRGYNGWGCPDEAHRKYVELVNSYRAEFRNMEQAFGEEASSKLPAIFAD